MFLVVAIYKVCHLPFFVFKALNFSVVFVFEYGPNLCIVFFFFSIILLVHVAKMVSNLQCLLFS